uniref:RNase H type-1 domain-containing protein n=1 Tax=Daucus carota subsp. sativus TaxID=79200 RepID=A0A175YIH9_DAUCS
MNCLFHAYSATLLLRSSRFVYKSSTCWFSTISFKRRHEYDALKSVNLDFLLTRFGVRCYATRRVKGSKSKSVSEKVELKSKVAMVKEEFFVVRKGDLVGVYKNFSDCQAQVGSSICDPPVSVYKGQAMPKDAETYLLSCGLKNALYSIRAADLTEGLFGTLVACPFLEPSQSRGETPSDVLPRKRLQELLGPEISINLIICSLHLQKESGSLSLSNSSRKHPKLEQHLKTDVLFSGPSCILEFDGASKGNPGQAGAGVVLRADDGTVICRLREGLGIATNNVAEYRAMILGLRFALEKGFTSIRVVGDSKLVCMQVQGLWKVKNQGISRWFEEAKKLKDKFLSFEITHVLRDLNSEADAQANLAVSLAGEAFLSALLTYKEPLLIADGQVQEDPGE